MKVAITYQVDFDEVPRAVAQLVKNLSDNDWQRLGKHFFDIQCHLGNNNYSSSLESIEDLRRALAKIDQKLIDYANIVAGYAKADVDLKSGLTEEEMLSAASSQTQEVSAENILDEKQEND